MSFDVQLIIVLVIVALAVGYVVRSGWKTFFGKKAGCGSGCGKCATPVVSSPRKGRIELPLV